MQRGELWLAQIDELRPVVVLSCAPGDSVRVIQIVRPATAAQRRGFLLMSGDQAVDANTRRRLIAEAGLVRAVGIEVGFGRSEGLVEEGVVRVALPQHGTIFCSWGTSLTERALIERIGSCSAEKLGELDAVLQLAGA